MNLKNESGVPGSGVNPSRTQDLERWSNMGQSPLLTRRLEYDEPTSDVWSTKQIAGVAIGMLLATGIATVCVVSAVYALLGTKHKKAQTKKPKKYSCAGEQHRTNYYRYSTIHGAGQTLAVVQEVVASEDQDMPNVDIMEMKPLQNYQTKSTTVMADCSVHVYEKPKGILLKSNEATPRNRNPAGISAESKMAAEEVYIVSLDTLEKWDDDVVCDYHQKNSKTEGPCGEATNSQVEEKLPLSENESLRCSIDDITCRDNIEFEKNYHEEFSNSKVPHRVRFE
ncbi:uncharacterized protein LOC106160603 [Lingula anatina]|uniref:Uncharacterized protein LOC106160603 n=1 Tax=Lingula anatina TaxID=7574 RepID=A0A1S3I361_LINAN|nr:uncharacterized protein LOC106160603 [Lingula anatina]|eukprot:XP_013392707.1 uncharacterized protein LOC106160603 [Lingula anatina]